jgi:nucleoid DNA-binding protein/preprotein translocase subunit SecG
MDLDLFSGIIRKLILVHDRVSLPGMGSFIAETAPSVFSDRAMVIHPPFRRILFRPGEIWNDGILEDAYAREFSLDDDVARKEIAEFVSYLKGELNTHKSVRIPEFGTMRATEQNDYFFVAEKGLFNYLETFGLEPLNIKILPKKGEIETHTKNAVKNFFGQLPRQKSAPDRIQGEAGESQKVSEPVNHNASESVHQNVAEKELVKADAAESQEVAEKETHKVVEKEVREVVEDKSQSVADHEISNAGEAESKEVVEKGSHIAGEVESKEAVDSESHKADEAESQGVSENELVEVTATEVREVVDNEHKRTSDKESHKTVEAKSQGSTEKEDESQSTSQEQHIEKVKDNVKEKESRFIKRVIIVLSVVFLILALIVAAVVFKDELRPFWEWLLYSEEEREFLRGM